MIVCILKLLSPACLLGRARLAPSWTCQKWLNVQCVWLQNGEAGGWVQKRVYSQWKQRRRPVRARPPRATGDAGRGLRMQKTRIHGKWMKAWQQNHWDYLVKHKVVVTRSMAMKSWEKRFLKRSSRTLESDLDLMRSKEKMVSVMFHTIQTFCAVTPLLSVPTHCPPLQLHTSWWPPHLLVVKA